MNDWVKYEVAYDCITTVEARLICESNGKLPFSDLVFKLLDLDKQKIFVMDKNASSRALNIYAYFIRNNIYDRDLIVKCIEEDLTELSQLGLVDEREV